MSEKFQNQPPSGNSWKQRGTKEKSYKARKLSHEASTSIEYGEKTWTTAQTVRDLMQNHLDAETEQYYQQITKTVFDENILEQYFGSKNGGTKRKKAEDFLYAAFTFAKYVEDMTPEARLQSERHLQDLAQELSVKSELQQDNLFSPSLFLEAVRPLSEEQPLVLYEVLDTNTNVSIGWIAYETFRDEPLYQSRNKNNFRYKILGMKIVDHGPGFDSQLSALYLSSKTGRRHLRGKFGEGVKMSELHLLRNGASIKMRSRYSIQGNDAAEKSRVWQIRPQVKEGRLVSRGIEIEQEVGEDTGSMISISLRGAKEAFHKDFIDSVDPRLGGLEENVADFRSHGFSYPMPVTEEHLAGVDTSGGGDTQYVQGLRVELAKESFGYEKPWFSYNFLDSSIIGGRDRNEITGEIKDRIQSFWHHVDSPELLKQLVRTAVHDVNKNSGRLFPNPELSALREIITSQNKSKSLTTDRIQKIVDSLLLHELALEKHVHTFVMTSADQKSRDLRDIISYAKEQGYEIKTTAADLGNWTLENFARRLPDDYKIVTLSDIRNEMRGQHKKENEEEGTTEGEREKAIRKVFLAAEASINEFASATGMKPKNFELEFDMPKRVNTNRRQDEYWNEEEEYAYSGWKLHSKIDLPPIALDWTGSADYKVRINPYRILGTSDPIALQRQIEIYLLSGFSHDAATLRDREDVLKGSQQLLDTLITKLIPEDAPILEVLSQQFEYEKDPAVISRLIRVILDKAESKRGKEKIIHETYKKVLSTQLDSKEAQEMHKSLLDGNLYMIKKILESRVFLSGETLTYYNAQKKSWENQQLTEKNQITEWQGLPVYALNDGRYFIPASMQRGAVLAKGEGKKREYTFNEGDNFLYIGLHSVGFGRYEGIYSSDVATNPDGLILPKTSGEHLRERGSGTEKDSIQKQLEEYTYYPTGTIKHEGNIEERVSSTAIPIEYGQDEWDNPIRIFQDVIQNHIDASEDGERVQLVYEVDRDGNRVSVSENDLSSSDKIIGLTIQDRGSGYYPNDIATMGATSKKSPLFAGKYGEGQKMVAAAALRNGLELIYRSTVQDSNGTQSWNAKTISETRVVVFSGKEVKKKLVAFDVTPTPDQFEPGSATTLRLPFEASPEQEKQWAEWVLIIDPRQKDTNGNGGLARYVRQLRQPGSERVHAVGSISVLLDEPGAVYENGLRINPQVEKGRALSFGYDVPEVVTTRERNSYNAARLEQYIRHTILNISDPFVVGEILSKVANSGGGTKTLDLDIGAIMNGGENIAPIWAEVAQKVWPDYVVYSSERISEEIYGSDDYERMGGYEDYEDEIRRKEEIERARYIEANMAHLDKGRVLDVPKDSYWGFSKLLPTVESVINKLETETLPMPPAVKKVLSEVVAESINIFADILRETKEAQTAEQFKYLHLFQDRFSKWNDVTSIENRNAVAIAPISSEFHGKVDIDNGVVFNEELLFEGNRRKLAETSLHEIAHIVSGYPDYTEHFIALMYELAQHLAKM